MKEKRKTQQQQQQKQSHFKIRIEEHIKKDNKSHIFKHLHAI